MDEPNQETPRSLLKRLATEESITLRGIYSPDQDTIDRSVLERLICANQQTLARQIVVLRRSLDDHDVQVRKNSPTGQTLQRLEALLEHTARLVHETQVLQKLKSLLDN